MSREDNPWLFFIVDYNADSSTLIIFVDSLVEFILRKMLN